MGSGRPQDEFARIIRRDERDLCIQMFRTVMTAEIYRGRHVDDAVREIISDVEKWYAKAEAAR